MHIGLDIDGVLADWERHARATYEEWFDLPLARSKSWHDLEEQSHFTSAAQFWAWIHRVPGFWRGIPPVPGALGGVYRLLGYGHRLTLITHRNQTLTAAQTQAWLHDHWPYDKQNFTNVPDVEYAKDKGSIPVQVYVDDSPAVITELVEAGKPNVLVFDQPWNRDLKVGYRVQDWDDLVDVIEYLRTGQRLADLADLSATDETIHELELEELPADPATEGHPMFEGLDV